MYGDLDDATYHEGIAIPGLFEHAWIEWHGVFIELTLSEVPFVQGYPVPACEFAGCRSSAGRMGTRLPGPSPRASFSRRSSFARMRLCGLVITSVNASK